MHCWLEPGTDASFKTRDPAVLYPPARRPIPTSHTMISLDDHGNTVFYNGVSLLCQTFVFGAFVLLMPLSTYVARKRGPRNVADCLRYCTWFMFLTSAIYIGFRVWSVSGFYSGLSSQRLRRGRHR